MSDFRVLCIGPPKSGTVTLHHAFTRAGLVSCHSRTGLDQPPVALQLWRGFVEDRDPLHYVAAGIEVIADAHLTRSTKWEGLTLWPAFAPGFLRAFRAHHPEAWVLLHTRKTEDWIASIGRWKDLRNRIVKAELPFLPAGRGGYDEDITEWIEGHYARVRRMFDGDARFLEVAIEDPKAPEKIGEALGIELPWWGVMNANPDDGPVYRDVVLRHALACTRKA